jgi:hypothetical protein
MSGLTAGDLEKRNQARILYAAILINQRDVNNNSTVRNIPLSQGDIVSGIIGSTFTSYEEQQNFLNNSRIMPQLIISGNKSISGSTNGLTNIDFTGITDGYVIDPNNSDEIDYGIDDGFIPIPMGGMVFNFFGTNYSNNIMWYSNNALVFGTEFSTEIVSISATTCKSILIGNYDRLCTDIHYSNTRSTNFSITTMIVNFCNVYDDPGTPTYKYQIRLIKENIDDRRQFVEVCVIDSPPTSGFSSVVNTLDTYANPVDGTKNSPYNITDGSSFLNPCKTTFSTSSPPAGSSFVFASNSTGTNWTFTNNSYVNV